MCCTQLAEIQDAKICYLGTIAQFCRAVDSQLKHVSTNRKKLFNSNISSTWPYNIANFGPLAAEIGRVWAPQPISTCFTSWQCYCSDVAHRRPTKLCTMSGRLLGWYTIYTLAPWRNFARCKTHFTPKSCILLYWQRYCTALQQQASAKLWGVVHRMELRNFRRRRHLYLAARPSRWASANILVINIF